MCLTCHTNNRTSSVLNVFQNSTQKFGLPSRVRADQGVKNVDVARFMLTHPLRDPDRKSFIAAKSCHNHWRERLWRDVFCYSLSKFYCVFWYLETLDYWMLLKKCTYLFYDWYFFHELM